MDNESLVSAAERMRFALGIAHTHLRDLINRHPETEDLMSGVMFCIEDAISHADQVMRG
jgi:hypothetical protein